MLKKTVLLIFVVTFAAVLAAQEMPTRVAVIDVDRVVMESAAGKESFKNLQNFQRAKMEEARAIEEKLAELEKKLNEQKFLLSDDKLAEMAKEFENQKIAYKRFQDDTQRELDQARAEELKKLEKKIMPIIEEIGREKNFALVFNKFNSGLVYAADAVDITDAVLLKFNTQVSVPPPSPE